MPQLDKLTFFTQLITTGCLFILFFVIFSSAILPALFRVQKVRKYMLQKVDDIDSPIVDLLGEVFDSIDEAFELIVPSINELMLIEDEILGSPLPAELIEVLEDVNVELLDYLFDLQLINDEDFDDTL